MSSGNRQHARAAVGVFGARVADVVGALQDLLDQWQDQFAGRGKADQALA